MSDYIEKLPKDSEIKFVNEGGKNSAYSLVKDSNGVCVEHKVTKDITAYLTKIVNEDPARKARLASGSDVNGGDYVGAVMDELSKPPKVMKIGVLDWHVRARFQAYKEYDELGHSAKHGSTELSSSSSYASDPLESFANDLGKCARVTAGAGIVLAAALAGSGYVKEYVQGDKKTEPLKPTTENVQTVASQKPRDLSYIEAEHKSDTKPSQPSTIVERVEAGGEVSKTGRVQR